VVRFFVFLFSVSLRIEFERNACMRPLWLPLLTFAPLPATRFAVMGERACPVWEPWAGKEERGTWRWIIRGLFLLFTKALSVAPSLSLFLLSPPFLDTTFQLPCECWTLHALRPPSSCRSVFLQECKWRALAMYTTYGFRRSRPPLTDI